MAIDWSNPNPVPAGGSNSGSLGMGFGTGRFGSWGGGQGGYNASSASGNSVGALQYTQPGLGETGMDFGAQYGAGANTGGGFNMNWAGAQRGFGLANAALSSIGLIQGILQNRSDAKLRKQSAQRGFNANAILANNAMRSRENAGTAFASAHGIDYSGPTQPMRRIGGWGKSGEGVGTPG
jgi:hypothetical protein